MSLHTMTEDSLTLDSQLSELAKVWSWVEALAAQYQIPDKTVFAIQLCLEEVLSNIIRHGYNGEPGHSFTVAFAPLATGLWSFTAEDSAPHFSPLESADKRAQAFPDLDTIKPGGLGIPILKKFTHSVSYQALPAGNRITLTFAARTD